MVSYNNIKTVSNFEPLNHFFNSEMNKKQIQPKPVHKIPQKKSKKEDVLLKIGRYYWMPALCIILAIFVYSPVFKAGFVNWDDDDYVVKNNTITSFGNLKEIVTVPVQGNIHPITMLTLAVNWAISGQRAGSYHLVNLLIHLLNIILVFLFIKKLTGNHGYEPQGKPRTPIPPQSSGVLYPPLRGIVRLKNFYSPENSGSKNFSLTNIRHFTEGGYLEGDQFRKTYL